MRPNTDETYESWAKRAQMYEHGHAMQRIAQGDDADVVLDDMSKRLMQKLLSPIYSAIRESTNIVYDIEASKLEYKEKYLDKNKPKADQVDGEVFDKLD